MVAQSACLPPIRMPHSTMLFAARDQPGYCLIRFEICRLELVSVRDRLMVGRLTLDQLV